VFGEQGIEVVEKVVAVVRVVFPGVLAVEDDADHRVFVGAGAVEDGFQLLHEVLCRVAAVPFGIVEADQVGQTFVAEEQRQPRGLPSSRQGW
jgi:hypothetical protein